MPNQSHSGQIGVPWHRCDRCGIDFRVSELRWQNGLLLCAADFDDPIAWQRQEIISEVLSDAAEEMQVAEILRNPDTNPVDSQ